jgi:predicted transcriptional regulator
MTIAATLVCVLALALAVLAGLLGRTRSARFAAEARVRELADLRDRMNARIEELADELKRRGVAAQGVEAERQTSAFDQHTRLNELTGKKLEAELKWLESQIEARDASRQRDEAWIEYHELMVEKTRLEMDSLRLYIQEQRKKLASDDWGH